MISCSQLAERSRRQHWGLPLPQDVVRMREHHPSWKAQHCQITPEQIMERRIYLSAFGEKGVE